MSNVQLTSINVELSVLATVTKSVEGYLSRQILQREDGDALVRQLSLLFSITAETAGGSEMASFDAMMTRLVDKASVDSRGFLAVQIAVSDNPPPRTLQKLARDVISVARPILVHSPMLDDEDLVSIAVDAGVAHMVAIAERAWLSIRVTDILVVKGDDTVRRSVTANHGAKLSNITFRILTDQARFDEILEESLVRREDVPRIIVRSLARNGSGRARLLLTEETPPREHRSVESWYKIYDFASAEMRVAMMTEQGFRGQKLFKRLVAEERFPEATIVFASLAYVRHSDLIEEIASDDMNLVLFLAKTLKLPLQTIFGYLNIGPWRHMIDGKRRQWAIRAYQNMSLETATKMLIDWRNKKRQ